ncbi:unnamed protein product, partial [Dibothriocephalus latus]
MTLSHETPASLSSAGPGGACKWPSNDFVAGEPLFDRPLTDSDFDALQEEAGLGPASWWLDPFLATNKSGEFVDTPTYEDEVALLAWAREPFESAGEIRDASHGLLNRLNELIHLQNLAQTASQKKTEALTKAPITLSSTFHNFQESLNVLKENLAQNSNGNKQLADSYDGSDNPLTHTYDADDLSDVFPSVRGSLDSRQSHETFNPKPPPLNKSAHGPSTGPRRPTYNVNATSHSTNRTFDILEIARQEEDSLRASAARSEQRSNSGQNSLRGSAEVSSAAGRAQRFAFSEKFAPRSSESPSRSHASNTSASRDDPRGSGSRKGLPAIPASPLDLAVHKTSDVGPSVLSSFQLPTGEKEVPAEASAARSRPPIDRKRAALGSSSATDLLDSQKLSTSNTSLRSITSEEILKIVAEQTKSLRASAEEMLKVARSKNSLSKSSEGLMTLRKSADNLSTSVGDGGASPARAASPAKSVTMPTRSYSPLGLLESQDGKNEAKDKSAKVAPDSGAPITDPFQLAKQQAASLRESKESFDRRTRTLYSEDFNEDIEEPAVDKVEQTSSTDSAQSASAR